MDAVRPGGRNGAGGLHRCDDEGVRRLVVCFDGTRNGRRPGRASNVEHAASCLARSERGGTEQVVSYQPGVGTHYGVDRAMGGLFGFGISSAILSGYRFLSLNYAPATRSHCWASAAAPTRRVASRTSSRTRACYGPSTCSTRWIGSGRRTGPEAKR